MTFRRQRYLSAFASMRRRRAMRTSAIGRIRTRVQQRHHVLLAASIGIPWVVVRNLILTFSACNGLRLTQSLAYGNAYGNRTST
jgi:hypothetical protein